MTRLFLSLYLFIAVTLVVLSGLLNYVFFNDDIDNQTSPLIQLVSALHQQSPLTAQQALQFGLSARQIDTADMAWSKAELNQLQNGEAISLFDKQAGNQLYLQIEPGHLLEVNLATKSPSVYHNFLYSSLFYLLLAGLIALWVWPVWRDLQTLKRAAKVIDINGQYVPIKLEHHSLLSPIADALNELGGRVRELLNTQLELTGAVAHEFRTPLSRLKFALATQSEQNVYHWQGMNEDVNELEKLVQEMLNYTSMESQQAELNISEIPLLSLCKQRIAILAQDNIQSLKVSTSGKNLPVLADSHYIERAIDNLLLNACRYAKSQIRVSVWATDKHVIAQVDDDGPGIELQHYEKIFEPFFRPDNGRDRQRGGAGLGLAIVKRIMLWHQGKCWAEPSNLGGARFCLVFNQLKLHAPNKLEDK